MQLKQLPAAHWNSTLIGRVLRPMHQFIQREQSNGIILMAMTVIALIIANSPLFETYDAILHAKVGIVVGPFELKETVIHWINDGLMAIFFFLVGLEIKREIMVGELSSIRVAALPIVAAIGGATIPALIYVFFNAGSIGSRGWGVPMATDIAFALGCLALLGNRVPFALKIFLTAVAIVDDLIAVLVIAIFYSGGLNFYALGIGLAVLVALFGLNLFGFRRPSLYALLGVVVWLAFLKSGVHATIAGVLVALTIPARNRIDAPTFLAKARSVLAEFERGNDDENTPMLTDERQQSAVIELEEICEDVQAPLQKIEHRLHGAVALLIMPIFALANAGVPINTASLAGEGMPVVLGVVLGLVIGKPIGIMLATWLAVRLKIADLPMGVTWMHMLGVGILAGIGFTMSLFIASLGFQNPDVLNTAKTAILIASVIAGVAGSLLLTRVNGRANSKQQMSAAEA